MKNYIVAFAGIILAISCARKPQHQQESLSDTTPVSDIITKIDEPASRKFIRTADGKFKVNDVIQTSRFVEDLVTSQGGYIALSKLKNVRENSYTVKHKVDSSVNSYESNIVNEFKIRIPDAKLDSTLRILENQAIY